jgi:hypothetical protein
MRCFSQVILLAIVVVVFALPAAGCGASLRTGRVAHIGSTSFTESASSAGSSHSGGSTISQSPTAQALAFSHCMRSQGVSSFPDPDSRGVWPKSEVELAAANPRFQPATQACGHLLPDGGPGVPPSPAVTQQIQTDMTKFAECMRSHGVPHWPDPTLDQGRAVFDPQAVGIDTNSPQISARMHECERVFPASIGIPPGA